MKINLLQDIVFPTVQIRELVEGEALPKSHNWVNVNGKTFIFEFEGGQAILDQKIKELLDPLKAVVEYQVYNRQVGHTTTMLEGVIHNPNAIVLVGNNTQKQWMMRELEHRGWTLSQAQDAVITIDNLQDGLYGLKDRPLILDNIALFELFYRIGGDTKNLNERKGEITSGTN